MSNVDQRPIRTWEQVAAEAAQETDTQRLLQLASELNQLLALSARRTAFRRPEIEKPE
jgi:hypothetical protein